MGIVNDFAIGVLSQGPLFRCLIGLYARKRYDRKPALVPRSGPYKPLLTHRSKVTPISPSSRRSRWTAGEETAKLKRLLAEQMLDLAAMKELVSKKW
ncbi:hypothetical protein SAMN05444339_11910 [Loktanella atrilutea]|uniref:Transposase n=1 Tax=Loktanella atrilutea TaxID=366533 RepID=A0A1M5FC84_LOKAT|nr:hypothetical protein SAMN05444339_11910 [Loktanella atrilutea]